MKFSAVSLLVAGLAVQASAIRILEPAAAAAVPAANKLGGSHLDIIPIEHPIEEVKIVHLELGTVNAVQPPRMAKGACAKSKAIKLSNWFRATLGLPLIETGHHFHPDGEHRHHQHHNANYLKDVEGESHPHPHHIHEGHGAEVVDAKKESGWVHILPFMPPMPAAPGRGSFAPESDSPHRHHRIHHFRKGGSFAHRLHRALMSLGLWEGRIMAFVLGCGIGVLLRMVWVLTVVFFRAVSAARRTREEQVETVFVYVDEAEHLLVPAPQYVVDEKIVPLAEV